MKTPSSSSCRQGPNQTAPRPSKHSSHPTSPAPEGHTTSRVEMAGAPISETLALALSLTPRKQLTLQRNAALSHLLAVLSMSPALS